MMPHRIAAFVSSQLAARAGIRQVRAVELADVAANAAERTVQLLWGEVLRAIKRRDVGTAWEWLTKLHGNVAHTASLSLRRVAVWGHRSARRDIGQSLPTAFAVDAAAAKAFNSDGGAITEGKSDEYGPDGRPRLRHPVGGRQGIDGGRVEGRGVSVDVLAGLDRGTLVTESLTVGNLLAAIRDPRDETTQPPRGDLMDFLFPAFTPQQVDHVVYANDWEDRLRAATKLAEPSALARIISTGLALGKSHQEIARDLRPAVQGVVTSARRIARTECMRVAQDAQMSCHQQLGDLVIGYQVHATIDEHTRPWHAHRSGQVYYLHPQPGQKGTDQQPNPPEEARDLSERPPGTPFVAYNCRCFLTPVLREPSKAVLSDKARGVLADNAAAVVPDTLIHSEWFDKTTDKKRKLFVGARPYNWMAGQVAKDGNWSGGKPDWPHFVDTTGRKLSLKQLQAESPAARATRVDAVRRQLAERRELLKQTATFGFLEEPKGTTKGQVRR
jgi:SPP1 gp7 family putative phage head morphogenesis protein